MAKIEINHLDGDGIIRFIKEEYSHLNFDGDICEVNICDIICDYVETNKVEN